MHAVVRVLPQPHNAERGRGGRGRGGLAASSSAAARLLSRRLAFIRTLGAVVPLPVLVARAHVVLEARAVAGAAIRAERRGSRETREEQKELEHFWRC